MKIFLIILAFKTLLTSYKIMNKCEPSFSLYDNISGKCIKCNNNFSLINNKCKPKKRNLFSNCNIGHCQRCRGDFNQICESCE